MAGHKSKSIHGAAPKRTRARARRPRAASPDRPQPVDRLPGRDPPPATLDDAIEQERGRMNRACSVLACLSHVLLYQDDFEGDPDRPSFSDLAELAHDLVADAIHRLDSLYVGHLPRRR
jgi:hypothetical protein